MIIKKMRAQFGALENEELGLRPGLNIISLPNESGKSTWCAFLRAMLYGIDSSERAKAGYKPDKLRYAPWSGKPMRGELEIIHGGREMSIKRDTKAQNSPMREFTAVYSGTSEPVPGLNGTNAGEYLTGASKAVFERSAFIKQGGLGVEGSAELEARIGALVSSGDETQSYGDADERLRAWQRARRFNKRGRIPELENEIYEKRMELNSLSSAGSEREEIERELSSAEDQLPALREALTEARKRVRLAALERMSENKNRLRGLENELHEAEGLCAERERALDVFPFAFGCSPEAARERAEKDAGDAREFAKIAKRRVPLFAWVIPLCLALIALVLGFALTKALLGAGGILLVLFLVLFMRWQSGEKLAREALGHRQKILDSYSAPNEEGILKAAEGFRAAYESLLTARAALNAKRSQLERASELEKGRDAEILAALDFSNGESSASLAERELSRAEARVASLRESLAKAEGGLSVMGDPLVIQTQIQALEAKRDELTEQYEALQLAVETLAEANSEIQTRFSPMLGKMAGELFYELSSGRYEKLSVDRKLTPEVRQTGESASREALFLSEGARDQMYLALRLAIACLVLPQDEPCPLILDDALASFDNERMGLALDLLEKMAETRQIILFTCHTRERDYMSAKGGL